MHFYSLLILSAITSVSALNPAARYAPQHLNQRGAYQGGWPLALAGSASTTCPSEASVKCTSANVNPSCCPSGQTCIYGAGQDANYCCPTSVDCNTAVLNFPRCANETWTMFHQLPAGYFCCEPGMIGVNPSTSPAGGLCEPQDQAIPTSLLATIVSQVGATATPTSANATMTGGGGGSGSTSVTNPSAGTTSTGIPGSSFQWSTGKEIGLGLAAVFVVAFVLGLGAIARRRRNARIIGGAYAGRQEYDEDGNPIYTQGYSSVGMGYNGGHSPYGGVGGIGGGRGNGGNNVTVNVVHGDQQT